MKLELHSLKRLVKNRKRVGRGGSRGGTSGKGTKGQNARSGGYVGPVFEGGQMPLYRRLPKRGFNNARFAQLVDIVSLAVLEKHFAHNDTVDRDTLIQKGVIKVDKSLGGCIPQLKILGGSSLTKRLIVCADAFSKSAMHAIQEVGGEARINKGAE